MFAVRWTLAKVPIQNSFLNSLTTNPSGTFYLLMPFCVQFQINWGGGGVVAMFCSILILFFLPILHKSVLKGLSFRPLGRMAFWFLIVNRELKIQRRLTPTTASGSEITARITSGYCLCDVSRRSGHVYDVKEAILPLRQKRE